MYAIHKNDLAKQQRRKEILLLVVNVTLEYKRQELNLIAPVSFLKKQTNVNLSGYFWVFLICCSSSLNTYISWFGFIF